MTDLTAVDLAATVLNWMFFLKLTLVIFLVCGIYFFGSSRGKAPFRDRVERLNSRLTQYRTALKNSQEKAKNLESQVKKLGVEVNNGLSAIAQKDKDYAQSVRKIRAENQEIVSSLIEDHKREIQELEKKKRG